MPLQILRARGNIGVSAFVFAFLIGLVACSPWLWAVEKGPADPPDTPAPRYRVFSLRYISAERATEFLDGIGTVSSLPKGNALLVTGLRTDLIKASTIVRLVDAPEEFVIKPVLPVSEKTAFPALEQIQALLPDIVFGTFLQPPDSMAVDRAVIDIHKDAVVVVAPARRLDEIISVITLIRSGKVPPRVKAGSAGRDTISQTETVLEAAAPAVPAFERLAAQPAEQNNGAGELFDKLINSLQKAEQTPKAAQLPEKPVPQVQPAAREPNQPPAVPEPAAVGESVAVAAKIEEPSVKTQPAAEPVTETIEQPRKQKPLYDYQPRPLIDGNEMLELDLPEELQIADLLRLVGEYCRLDYMYDAKKITGPVTLKLRGPIKVRDLYPLLESVLKFKGFVMTRKGNLVTIVPQEELLNIDPLLLDGQPAQIEVGDVMVTRVFQLEHADTESAKNLLTGMKLGVDVTPIPATGTLIVSCYAYRMPRIEKLLEMIDVPGEPKKFKFRQLKYTMARTLAPKIKGLVEQLGTISITIAEPAPTPQPAQPAPRGARRPTPVRRPSSAEQPEKSEEVYLDADERTNRILMIGLENQLAVVDELIDSLDVEQQDLRKLRLYDIQFVDAEEVVEKLGQLGIITGTDSRADRQRITSRTERQPKPAGAATEIEEPLEEEPQVIVIESTNSLLVNGTDEQHIRIVTIISYIDAETLQETIPYKVYSLENQQPEELAEVLTKLIEQTITKEKKDDKIERPASTSRQVDKPVIVADKNTFSIIVHANQKDQRWIESLITQLDRRRPQVLIDVSLVEITEEDKFEYDLNIIGNIKDAALSNVLTANPFSAFTTGGLASDAHKLEGTWNLKDADGKNTRQVQGFYAEDKIAAVLTAMESKGYGRILARPKILVNDNEEGKIKTTEKTHVAETSITYGSQQVTEPLTSIKWTPYEAKIELTITPHISDGRLLRLEVVMVREDFVKTTAGPPDYRTSDIDTVVTVPDGSTVILGGLTKLNQTKGTSKVPLLGDIPIAGALFRSIGNSDTGSKLYIFVKANILRPDETVEGLAQLRDISKTNRLGFEDDERKFQSLESFPGVKPEPMDPLRVLDDI